MTEQALTVDQVADLVQLSTEAVRRAIRRGELRASKLGGRLRITPAALDEWMKASEVQPEEPASTHERPQRARSAALPPAPRRDSLRVLMETHAGQAR